jgi:glutaredoxin 3
MTVEIWGKENCAFCTRAKSLVESKGISYVYKQMGVDFTRDEVFEQFPGARTFPQIKVDGKPIGGFNELSEMYG